MVRPLSLIPHPSSLIPHPSARSIVLIGYRGTGKTAVARLVAQRLGWLGVDTDEQIERRSGMSIAEIFQRNGEDAFRDMEVEVIAELVQRPRCVLALGGGAVMRQENRQAISQCGHVVWLRARAETIQQRIGSDPASRSQRPNLTPRGGLGEIRRLLSQRTPVYEQCADQIIDTDGKTPEQVADEIIRGQSARHNTD
jgi:shikimate kinase